MAHFSNLRATLFSPLWSIEVFYILIICKIRGEAIIRSMRMPRRSHFIAKYFYSVRFVRLEIERIPVVMATKILGGHKAYYDEVGSVPLIIPSNSYVLTFAYIMKCILEFLNKVSLLFKIRLSSLLIRGEWRYRFNILLMNVINSFALIVGLLEED